MDSNDGYTNRDVEFNSIQERMLQTAAHTHTRTHSYTHTRVCAHTLIHTPKHTHTHAHTLFASLTRTKHEIYNLALMKEIEDAYKKFLASKLSLEDFFKISILCATRYNGDKFNIKPSKLKYDRVIMVFRDHPKNPDDYFLGQDFSNLHSKSPIEIKIESLMSMLEKPLGNFEDMCTVYKLENTKDSHGKKVIRGHKHYSVPGGDGDIKVGVWKWNLDEPNTVFWLPSENLIEDLYRCDKTPSCGYTTKRSQVSLLLLLR